MQKPCTKCNEPAYIEKGMEGCKDPVVCLMCADDNAIVFVEMPPDEFGRRSISVTAKQVREQDDGRWHKKGFWHSAQWAFANQES